MIIQTKILIINLIFIIKFASKPNIFNFPLKIVQLSRVKQLQLNLALYEAYYQQINKFKKQLHQLWFSKFSSEIKFTIIPRYIILILNRYKSIIAFSLHTNITLFNGISEELQKPKICSLLNHLITFSQDISRSIVQSACFH